MFAQIITRRKLSPGSPERFVRIYLALAAVSLVLILALSFYVLSNHNNRNLLRDAEMNAAMLVQFISTHEFESIIILPNDGNPTLHVDRTCIPRLNQSIKALLAPFKIRKIKIYNTQKQIIYCTDAPLIGKLDPNNTLLKAALNGHTRSKIRQRADMPDLSSEHQISADIAEVYVPIYDAQRRIVGAFELYADITDLKQELGNHLRSSMGVISISLLPLLLLSYLIVRKETTELRNAHRLLETIAATDALTGIANRYHLLRQAEEHFSLIRRKRRKLGSSTGLGLIMIDADYFKQVNDRYGHLVGDEVLVIMAKRINQVVRTYDVFGRYGGEEFLVVLPQTHCSEVEEIAHRINRIVADNPFELEGLTINATVSVGCSWSNAHDEELDVALRRADQNLYDAKQRGRNQVAFCAVHQGSKEE